MKTIILTTLMIGLGIHAIAQQTETITTQPIPGQRVEQQPIRGTIVTTPIPGQQVEQQSTRSPIITTPIPGQKVERNPRMEMELKRQANDVRKTDIPTQKIERTQPIGRDGIMNRDDAKTYSAPKEKVIQQRTNTITDGLTEDQKSEQLRKRKEVKKIVPQAGQDGVNSVEPRK